MHRPVTSREISFLVRWLVLLSVWLNARLGLDRPVQEEDMSESLFQVSHTPLKWCLPGNALARMMGSWTLCRALCECKQLRAGMHCLRQHKARQSAACDSVSGVCNVSGTSGHNAVFNRTQHVGARGAVQSVNIEHALRSFVVDVHVCEMFCWDCVAVTAIIECVGMKCLQECDHLASRTMLLTTMRLLHRTP